MIFKCIQSYTLEKSTYSWFTLSEETHLIIPVFIKNLDKITLINIYSLTCRDYPDAGLEDEMAEAKPKAKVTTQLSQTLSEDPANVAAKLGAEVNSWNL